MTLRFFRSNALAHRPERHRSSQRVLRGGRAFLVFAMIATAVASASAEAPTDQRRIVVDRVVARFTAPEAGGSEHPHFIYEREISFEARLVAMADPAFREGGDEPYRRHHLQAALERHVAEELLASLSMDPEPTDKVVSQQLAAAREMAEHQAGGEAKLLAAARAEGQGSLELRRLFRRRARASLYLDRMVAPMLEPTDLELRRAHRSGKTPFSAQPYAEAEKALRRWYIARNLRAAAASYYQNARSRLKIHLF